MSEFDVVPDEIGEAYCEALCMELNELLAELCARQRWKMQDPDSLDRARDLLKHARDLVDALEEKAR